MQEDSPHESITEVLIATCLENIITHNWLEEIFKLQRRKKL